MNVINNAMIRQYGQKLCRDLRLPRCELKSWTIVREELEDGCQKP